MEEAVLVREQGFVEGASVLRKKDKVRATIESLGRRSNCLWTQRMFLDTLSFRLDLS